MLEIRIAKVGIASGGGIVITEDVLKAIAEGEPERYTYDAVTGVLYLNLKVAVHMAHDMTSFGYRIRDYAALPH